MPLKLVIFDLDNTLIVTSLAAKDAYKRAITYLAAQHGQKQKASKLYNHWKRLVQSLKQDTDPAKRQFHYSLSLLMDKQGLPDTYISQAIAQFNKEFLSQLTLQRGVKEIFSWLKDHRLQIGIATESLRSQAKSKLKAVGLYPEVDYLVTATDIGTMKPNPAYFTHLLKLSDVSTSSAVVVGDQSVQDLEPARSLGLVTLQVPPNNFHLKAIQAQIIKHFPELED